MTPEEKRAYMREYYRKNREARKEYMQKYFQENRERLVKKQRAIRRGEIKPEPKRVATPDPVIVEERKAEIERVRFILAEQKDQPAGSGGICRHCGRAYIRRFTGQLYCRRPACLRAEERLLTPLRWSQFVRNFTI